MFFVSLYRFFRNHKPLLYTLLIITSVVFVFFGTKVRYEEDLSQLLPSTETQESGLVFGNLKVKDKIFMEMTGAAPETMAGYVDELMDSILQDPDHIANTLYKLDVDVALNALDYALAHVPSFVSPDLYPRFDEAIAHADETMAKNYDLVMNDETGAATQMVTTDPLNLRELLLPEISGSMGYTLIDGHLFSKDSTVALMFISPNTQSFDSRSSQALIQYLEERIQQFEQAHPEVKVLFHGAPVRSAGNSQMMHRDIALTICLSLAVILILLSLCFKSVNILWQNVLPVAYGTFFALACMYWIKGGMSLMALGIGSVVLGVAVSYCLHVIIHQHFVGDVEKMLSDEAKPVCLGCITTIGAFLGLLFTKSTLLQDFGLFATFMLIGNTLFALIFLPHFLKSGDAPHNEKVFKLIHKVNDYAYDRNPVLIIALVLIIVVGFIFSPKVKFDNNLKHIGYESDALHASEKLYAEKFTGGGIQRYYAVVAPTLDEALDANQRLAATLDSLRRQGLLTSYTPVVSMLFQSEKEQQARIQAWREYWTPEKINEAEAAIQRAARAHDLDPSIFVPFRALVESDYEAGDLYGDSLVPDGLLCNFIEQSDGRFLIFNATEMDVYYKEHIDNQIAAMPHAVVVDPFYYTGNMISLIHKDFKSILLISSLFVLAVLFLSFRRVSVTLLAFLPMFLSWYVVQGWMAIFGLQFNLINIVISTFIFGIGVDYSIFVVQGLLAEARGEDTHLLSYHKVAIFFSALVLIIVVCAMIFATHPAIKSIGICTLIGMASTILITYTLQPLLFRWMIKIPFIRKSLKIS
ncbi:MAG: MMPL family transporter [Bacteroidales bacterium]|nr:MMPL family transporter [Bacteroidales bacterium]